MNRKPIQEVHSDLKALIGTGIKFPSCRDLFIIASAELVGQDTLVITVEPLSHGMPTPSYVREVFISYQYYAIKWVSK